MHCDRYATIRLHGKIMIRCVGRLHKHAVHAARDIQVVAVEVRLDNGSQRAEGIVALSACPLAVLELGRPVRYIVSDCVAEDRIGDLLFRDVLYASADHDHELGFEVDAVLKGVRKHDRIVRSADRGGRLQEYERRRRVGDARLVRMLPVIEAETDNVGWRDGRKERDGMGGSRREASLRAREGVSIAGIDKVIFDDAVLCLSVT